MKDIGFDLIDRRTVIIALFTFVLANIFLGYQIPVDIQNAQNLFIGLVILTGYIYLARTIYRLPFVLIVSIIISVNYYIENWIKNKEKDDESPQSGTNSFFKRLGVFVLTSIAWIIYIIFSLPFFMILLLYLVLTFGDYSEKEYDIISSLPKKAESYFRKHRSVTKTAKVFLSILDRIGVVCVAVIATMPQLQNLVKIIGVSGLIAMIALFIFRGDFTALVKDVLEAKDKKGEKDKQKDVNVFDKDTPINVKNSASNPIYVEVVNTDKRPVVVENTQYAPLHVTVKHPESLPVHIVSGSLTPLDYPFPVYIVNRVNAKKDNGES